jgi:AcrR family transcriptional regulator
MADELAFQSAQRTWERADAIVAGTRVGDAPTGPLYAARRLAYADTMSTEPRAGRPKVSSRETIAEAACELLEQGYERTTVAEIALRAGVGRSSFFNYFGSKADVLWGGFDERADAACAELAAGADVRETLRGIAVGFAPDSLALAITHAGAMGMTDGLVAERALRQARLGRAITAKLVADGRPDLPAEIRAAAAAAALFAAVWAGRSARAHRLPCCAGGGARIRADRPARNSSAPASSPARDRCASTRNSPTRARPSRPLA